MSTLIQYEPFVDSTTELFLSQTDKIYASTGESCDFSRWLQFYAFDVIGEMTYSKRHGFLEENKDIDGIIKYLGSLFDYVAPVSPTYMYTSHSPNPKYADWPNPLPRSAVIEESSLSFSREVWISRCHLPRRPLRPTTHGRALPQRPEIRPPHHNALPFPLPTRPPLQIHASENRPSRIHDRFASDDHGRIHGLRRLRNHRHFPVFGLLFPAQESEMYGESYGGIR